jgi:hypothetical protein
LQLPLPTSHDRPVLRTAPLLVSLSLVIALPAAASDGAAARWVTIRVIVIPVKRSFNDVAPKTHGTTGEYTKGDTISGTSILRNAVRQFGQAKGARVGTSRFVITALSPHTARADSVARIPGGTVHVHGVSTIAGTPKVPIVGGTGRYAGATGAVEGHVLANGEQLDVIRLQVR